MEFWALFVFLIFLYLLRLARDIPVRGAGYEPSAHYLPSYEARQIVMQESQTISMVVLYIHLYLHCRRCGFHSCLYSIALLV
jgi:hypothetical protein